MKGRGGFVGVERALVFILRMCLGDFFFKLFVYFGCYCFKDFCSISVFGVLENKFYMLELICLYIGEGLFDLSVFLIVFLIF